MRSTNASRTLAVAIALTAVTAALVAVPGAASAVTCRAYTSIGVRGTSDGARNSVGNMLPKAVDEFKAVKGSGNVTSDYVDYPATGVSWNSVYTSSMSAGRTALKSKISSWSSSCRSTKIVLFGYSQGAHIVGDVLVGLSSTARTRIYGVGLLGDPMFNPSLRNSVTADRNHGGMFGRRSSWPSGPFVYDLCDKGDQVCASISTAQSLGYLSGTLGPPREHTGYTGTTYSPIAGHSGGWWVGYHVANRS